MTSDFLPYQVNEAVYKRFDQRNICFSRWRWDEGFIAYGRGIYYRAPEKIAQGIEGYTQELFAELNASWHVHDVFPRIRTLNTGEGERDSFPSVGNQSSRQDAEQNSLLLKDFAMKMGAPLVGTTVVNQKWIYSRDEEGNEIDLEGLPNAVVFLVPMNQEMLKKSPTYVASTAVGRAYSRCRFIGESLAEFINRLGFRALPAVNEIAISVPLAIDAGLGEFARNGMLITERFGMGVRIGKVLTDMPLAQDSPIKLGVRRFCEKCKKCAESCPVKAISFDDLPDGTVHSKSNNPGILKWYVNVDKCYKFWTSNSSDCSNCVTSCPFTKPDTWSHNLARSIIKQTGTFNSLFLKLDNLLYGRPKN